MKKAGQRSLSRLFVDASLFIALLRQRRRHFFQPRARVLGDFRQHRVVVDETDHGNRIAQRYDRASLFGVFVNDHIAGKKHANQFVCRQGLKCKWRIAMGSKFTD